MSPMQQMFENMAQSIMKKYQNKLDTSYSSIVRQDCIKDMMAELLELKNGYGKLVSMPNVPFEEYCNLKAIA